MEEGQGLHRRGAGRSFASGTGESLDVSPGMHRRATSSLYREDAGRESETPSRNSCGRLRSDEEVEALYAGLDFVGQTIEASKVKYTWLLTIKGVKHEVAFFHSKVTGKKRLIVDGRIINEQFSMRAHKFLYSWPLQEHLLSIFFEASGGLFHLTIDGLPFSYFKRRNRMQRHPHLAAEERRGHSSAYATAAACIAASSGALPASVSLPGRQGSAVSFAPAPVEGPLRPVSSSHGVSSRHRSSLPSNVPTAAGPRSRLATSDEPPAASAGAAGKEERRRAEGRREEGRRGEAKIGEGRREEGREEGRRDEGKIGDGRREEGREEEGRREEGKREEGKRGEGRREGGRGEGRGAETASGAMESKRVEGTRSGEICESQGSEEGGVDLLELFGASAPPPKQNSLSLLAMGSGLVFASDSPREPERCTSSLDALPLSVFAPHYGEPRGREPDAFASASPQCASFHSRSAQESPLSSSPLPLCSAGVRRERVDADQEFAAGSAFVRRDIPFSAAAPEASLATPWAAKDSDAAFAFSHSPPGISEASLPQLQGWCTTPGATAKNPLAGIEAGDARRPSPLSSPAFCVSPQHSPRPREASSACDRSERERGPGKSTGQEQRFSFQQSETLDASAPLALLAGDAQNNATVAVSLRGASPSLSTFDGSGGRPRAAERQSALAPEEDPACWSPRRDEVATAAAPSEEGRFLGELTGLKEWGDGERCLRLEAERHTEREELRASENSGGGGASQEAARRQRSPETCVEIGWGGAGGERGERVRREGRSENAGHENSGRTVFFSSGVGRQDGSFFSVAGDDSRPGLSAGEKAGEKVTDTQRQEMGKNIERTQAARREEAEEEEKDPFADLMSLAGSKFQLPTHAEPTASGDARSSHLAF
ncbi:hypothetical protein TGDOM2_264900 [Toxoplasma gondii GAB2-2007-GAL-DOM2]|uniref:Uncharacterized protein n=4 Tax=Toxoplasma gondii TaxID=5811 RepID=S7VP56_TOXGG|nr:hypothetical protein TGGT1_264900 [Toxoplasma gondii GT1]KAF4644263.1 hypothetical protein TGRH88_012550 [Toxoplasma gondii]KFG38447.1 hypothetical protein TGDOM2_264900 [Toxoplasma gondii GAB2-2007-GAL-DOM2]RQX73962.1 hypothetical protein TGCAST_264900 [Toxoplasma gondii CAST]